MRKIIRRSPRLVVLSSIVALAAVSCGSDSADSTPLDSLPPVTEASEPAADPVATVATDESGDQAVDDADDGVAADTVVFVWTESGGCQMAGPNCARYEVTAGGTVETYRLGTPDEDMAGPAATGEVDPALVQAWQEAIDGADLDALRDRVGPGEMKAAFDGVDHVLTDPVADVELSSVDSDFDESEPVFSTAVALASAAREAAPLELEMR